MNTIINTFSRPDSKRKLLVALFFVISYTLCIAEVLNDIKSLNAWGSLLGLTIMAFTAWPLIKDFIWPSGLEHVAATQLSLACHGWKNAYLSIDSDLQNRMKEVEGDNIWQLILAASKLESSPENLAKFKTLFIESAANIQQRIETVLNRYADVLPNELRVLAQSAITQLSLAPICYLFVIQNPSDQAFYNQFLQIINVLEKLERPSHELQNITKQN